MRDSRDRREAEALQQALERHARLLGEGMERAEARAVAASEVGAESAVLVGLAVGLGDAAAPMPSPRFADAFAAKLRTEGAVQRLRQREARQRRWFMGRLPGLGTLAAAAAIAIFAGLLVPAFRSLPGDSLYSFKRTAESARLAVVSGSREAHLRLQLAAKRYEEVELLVERAQVRGVGPGLAAIGGISDIKDPELAALIESTLADAQQHIEAAASILIAERSDAQGLDDLVTVIQRGRRLAEKVAQDLPGSIQPPVLSTVVSLAKIEAEAKAARMMVEPPPPPPCATPTPEASPTPTPSEVPSPTATPEATTTPEPTPCVSPSPTPEPVATPTPSPTPSSESASASETSAQPSPSDEPRRDESSNRGTPEPGASGGSAGA